MDALARHRMLLLAGVPLPAMAVPARVEVRNEVMGYDDEPDELEAEEDVEDEDDEDVDDESEEEDLELDESEEDDEPESPAMVRHRQLQMLGIELRARSNPAPGRQVLTPAGSKRYKLPIGATILPNGQVLFRGRTMDRAEATQLYLGENPDAAVPAKKAAKAAPAKKATARAEPTNAPRVTALEPGAPAPHNEYGLPVGAPIPTGARRLGTDQDLRLRLLLEADNPKYNRYLGWRERGRSHSDAAMLVDMPTLAQLELKLGARSGRISPLPAAPAKKATPAAQDLTGSGGLSAVPAVREVQVENRIRQAVAALRADPFARVPGFTAQTTVDLRPGGDWVLIPEIRTLLRDVDQAELDAALRRLHRQPGVRTSTEFGELNLPPELKGRHIRLGGQDKYWFSMDDTTLRPLPAAAAPPPGPAPPDRQARIDAARGVAEALAEVDELVDGGMPADALDVRIRSRIGRGVGLTQAQVVELTAAAQSGDQTRLNAVVDEIATAAGLVRVSGRTGEVEPFQVGTHRNIGGGDLRGKMVRIIRPGYAMPGVERQPFDTGTGPLVIVKADVQEADEAASAEALARQVRERQGASGPAFKASRVAAEASVAAASPAGLERLDRITATMQGLTRPQLRAVARESGIAVPPNGWSGTDTDDGLRTFIARMLDSFAISGGQIPGTTSEAAGGNGANLNAMTVPALRALARERGIRIPSGARKADIIRLLGGVPTTPAQRSRTLALLGVEDRADVNPKPGDNNLRNYWVYGEGRKKWNTFTELRKHLLEHVGPERADRIAAEWFHLRFGFWPGDDRNRVRQGKPPRGEKVGPG